MKPEGTRGRKRRNSGKGRNIFGAAVLLVLVLTAGYLVAARGKSGLAVETTRNGAVAEVSVNSEAPTETPAANIEAAAPANSEAAAEISGSSTGTGNRVKPEVPGTVEYQAYLDSEPLLPDGNESFYKLQLEHFNGDISERFPCYADLDLDQDGLRDRILREEGETPRGSFRIVFGSGEEFPIDWIRDNPTAGGPTLMFSVCDLNADGTQELLLEEVYEPNGSGGIRTDGVWLIYRNTAAWTYRELTLPYGNRYYSAAAQEMRVVLDESGAVITIPYKALPDLGTGEEVADYKLEGYGWVFDVTFTEDGRGLVWLLDAGGGYKKGVCFYGMQLDYDGDGFFHYRDAGAELARDRWPGFYEVVNGTASGYSADLGRAPES